MEEYVSVSRLTWMLGLHGTHDRVATARDKTHPTRFAPSSYGRPKCTNIVDTWDGCWRYLSCIPSTREYGTRPFKCMGSNRLRKTLWGKFMIGWKKNFLDHRFIFIFQVDGSAETTRVTTCFIHSVIKAIVQTTSG